MKFGRQKFRRLRRWLGPAAGVALGLTLLINNWVINNTYAYIFDDWSLLPDNDAALVLGTSTLTRSGEPNPQFRGRIEAAAQLYQSGKVKRIIVSGAKNGPGYIEPKMMRRELMKAGVPGDAILMDIAGYRTYDSVVRAQRVFGLDRLTIVTQRYHAYRAVFIAKKLHLNAVAFAAPGEEDSIFTRTRLREYFARVKAVLDIYVLRSEPNLDNSPQGTDSDSPP